MTNTLDMGYFLYIDSNLKQQGPTTAAEMKYLVSANLINLNTYVWKQGMCEWLPIQQIPDLHSYLFQATNTLLNSEDSKAVDASYSEADKPFDSNKQKTKQRKSKKKIRKKGWIYVTGLPEDVTITELHQYFSKAGLIQEDALTAEPLIKIYFDQTTGKAKGDCSIGYVKPESVELALSVLDEGILRVNDPSKRLKITYAEVDSTNSNNENPATESISERLEKKRKRQGEGWETAVQLRKLKQQQLLSWNEEGLGDQGGLKVVIIKNLYNADDLEDDTFCNELLETLGDECSKLGTVKQITFFERSPEGVAKVRFESSRGAEECVKLMNGRWFDKRQLEAFFWDGKTSYSVKKSEEEDINRIEQLGDWLENEYTE